MYMHNEMTERNPIDDKIELLQDFRILKGNAKRQKDIIRAILATCESEVQMEQKIHNLLYGKETLKDFIDRHKPQLR